MTKAKRSKLMSKIKGTNTGIEKILVRELKNRGIKGFKRYANMIGKPDIIFPKAKIIVFCDGDFWHGYKFESWKNKLNNFWSDKILTNIRRDRKIRRMLKKDGWKVVSFWGHQIEKNPELCVDKILKLMVLK